MISVYHEYGHRKTGIDKGLTEQLPDIDSDIEMAVADCIQYVLFEFDLRFVQIERTKDGMVWVSFELDEGYYQQFKFVKGN